MKYRVYGDAQFTLRITYWGNTLYETFSNYAWWRLDVDNETYIRTDKQIVSVSISILFPWNRERSNRTWSVTKRVANVRSTLYRTKKTGEKLFFSVGYSHCRGAVTKRIARLKFILLMLGNSYFQKGISTSIVFHSGHVINRRRVASFLFRSFSRRKFSFDFLPYVSHKLLLRTVKVC